MTSDRLETSMRPVLGLVFIMKNDPASLHAYSQSLLSQVSTVLCFMILLPAILFLPISAVWGLLLFVLAFILSQFLYGMFFSFDSQNRQVKVTRAWFYYFRTSSFVIDFKDVQFIQIMRADPACDEIELKMSHRTYRLGGLDVDEFFLKLCKMFPQFTPPEPQAPLASISDSFTHE